MVAEYAGISLFDVNNLCYYDYLLLLRDAVIHNASQTQNGREYLEKCWMLEQTKPERKKLKKELGGEG